MYNHDNTYKPNQNIQRKSNTITSKKPRRVDPAPSYHAYGASAAIEFTCEVTKKQQLHTIAMHAATANKGAKGYNWEEKTVIQVPRIELPVVAAVLMGKMKRSNFSQTGMMGEKGFSLLNKNKKIILTITDSEKANREIVLSPEDVFQVASLFLRQIKFNMSWMTAAEVIELIDRTIVPSKVSSYERYNTDEENSNNQAEDSQQPADNSNNQTEDSQQPADNGNRSFSHGVPSAG